ncbi:hypothetical protein HanRHA438_Chr02g0048771 [Helianthus annuus]|nr:hypothetical protein HanRHA438_Chr02g0048771 [Helianthus annuus]
MSTPPRFPSHRTSTNDCIFSQPSDCNSILIATLPISKAGVQNNFGGYIYGPSNFDKHTRHFSLVFFPMSKELVAQRT